MPWRTCRAVLGDDPGAAGLVGTVFRLLQPDWTSTQPRSSTTLIGYRLLHGQFGLARPVRCPGCPGLALVISPLVREPRAARAAAPSIAEVCWGT